MLKALVIYIESGQKTSKSLLALFRAGQHKWEIKLNYNTN